MIFNLQRQNLVTQLYLCSYPSTFCQRASTKLFQNSFQNAQFTIFLAIVIMTFNFRCKELLKIHVHFHGEKMIRISQIWFQSIGEKMGFQSLRLLRSAVYVAPSYLPRKVG